ncbi:lipoprotein [Legionella sp. 31fI33]|uniref:LPS translocon maturation chaperone LptM n=1 Tax=Legionella sp. 31fI33 TaxID=2886376 RepID=UPI00351CFB84
MSTVPNSAFMMNSLYSVIYYCRLCMMRLLTIILIIWASLVLSACGQKGPLYLPTDTQTPKKSQLPQ